MQLTRRYKIIQFGGNKEILQKLQEDGFYILQCDASYDTTIKKGTAAVVIKSPNGKEYTPKSFEFKSYGPVHAEIKSIVYGLKEIQGLRQDIKKVLVLNDSKYAIEFIAGNWTAQREYIKNVIREVRAKLEKIKFEIRFGHVKSNLNKRVDKRAKKKLEKVKEDTSERIAKRVEKVSKNREKGKQFTKYEVVNSSTVKLKDAKSDYWFTVSFEPYPSCTCYWWKNNWGNKKEYLIRARALPCSHMCRAAELLNKNIFHIFRKQILRGD